MNLSYPELSSEEGEPFPGQITREEAARLTRSAVFCVAGLEYWAEYKPVLIYYDELVLLDDFDWDIIADLEDSGLLPEPLFTTCPNEEPIYPMCDIENCRFRLLTQSQLIEGGVTNEHQAAVMTS